MVLATVTSYLSGPTSSGAWAVKHCTTEIAAQALKLVAFAVHRGLAHQPDQHGGPRQLGHRARLGIGDSRRPAPGIRAARRFSRRRCRRRRPCVRGPCAASAARVRRRRIRGRLTAARLAGRLGSGSFRSAAQHRLGRLRPCAEHQLLQPRDRELLAGQQIHDEVIRRHDRGEDVVIPLGKLSRGDPLLQIVDLVRLQLDDLRGARFRGHARLRTPGRTCRQPSRPPVSRSFLGRAAA